MKLILLLLAFSARFCQGIDCPPGFKSSTKTDDCFYVGEASPWYDADKKCKAQGGLLYEPVDLLDPLLTEVQVPNSVFAFAAWVGIFTDEDGGLAYSSNYGSATIPYSNSTKEEKGCIRFTAGDKFAKFIRSDCLNKFSYICVYKPWYPCYTCPWYHGQCEEQSKPEKCFRKNRIFIEDSLPMKMSLLDCQKSCKSASACKFFTYSQITKRCGLRFYNPGGVVKSPGQVSGTETKILSENEVFVGRTEHITDPFKCQEACQKDPKCQSMTWNNAFTGNPNTCVFNYGPTIIDPFVGFGSGIRSAPKFCPGDCLRREKTLPNFDFNGQEYPKLF